MLAEYEEYCIEAGKFSAKEIWNTDAGSFVVHRG